MTQYKAITNIEVNGRHYEAEDIVEDLTEDEALDLLEKEAITEDLEFDPADVPTDGNIPDVNELIHEGDDEEDAEDTEDDQEANG